MVRKARRCWPNRRPRPKDTTVEMARAQSLLALSAPFPWFGGKRRVAHLVWSRFGNVPNYVEPFAGSLATLLGRPWAGHYETVNDKDANLVNFWRAVQADPATVARHAEWPVMEWDLHARHAWLIRTTEERRQQLLADPRWYDAQAAGWWCWGICLWIGGGWCGERSVLKFPAPTTSPEAEPATVKTQRIRPHITNLNGIHAVKLRTEVPVVLASDNPDEIWEDGREVITTARRRFHEKPGGTLSQGRRNGVVQWMEALSDRLRHVRVLSGDWARCVTPAVTCNLGLTGVFLDPPYSHEVGRDNELYANDGDISGDVCAWAIKHGANPKMRIALCGYEGEHEMPADWECVTWTAHGGLGHIAKQGGGPGLENRKRERIWFSPHCLKDGLFAALEEEQDASK